MDRAGFQSSLRDLCPSKLAHPTLKPEKCIIDSRGRFKRLVCIAKSDILATRQKPSILDVLCEGRRKWVSVSSSMSKGLQALDFSFEAESLTHFGGLFLIQRFCNKLCLRRRLERILRDAPNWTDYHPADLVLVL